MTDFRSEVTAGSEPGSGTHSETGAVTKAGQVLVLSTCPDLDSARQIADTLVSRGLAACVNINPGIESVYRWKDKIEHDEEVLLIIKTRVERYSDVEDAICALHPYELPEVVMVSIDKGLQTYLHWIDRSLDVQS